MISSNISNLSWTIILIIVSIGGHNCNNYRGKNPFLTQVTPELNRTQTASFFSTLFERLGDLEEQIIESVKKFTGFFTSYYGNAAPDWQSFKAMYRKFYTNSVSESTYKQIFIQNVQRIKSHNAQYEDGLVTYTLGINEFSDEDPKTFSSLRNGYKPLNTTIVTDEINYALTLSPISSLATNFDWRLRGKVSRVKDQGECGSCWAFSAIGALESQMLIAGRRRIPLSEEQLVDCDKDNSGCNGGHYLTAWNYIKKTGGIQSEKDYPYTAIKGKVGSCKFENAKVVTTVRGSYRVRNDVNQIMARVNFIGPLSASMDASNLQQYKGGIFKCSNAIVNHAVLIVGFGTDNNEDYWIVKNSWGPRWGEKGYVRVSRNSGSDCGLSQNVAYATV